MARRDWLIVVELNRVTNTSSYSAIDGLSMYLGTFCQFRTGANSEDTVFYASPAYKALLDWADLHPKKARSASSKATHLKGWLTPKI